MSTHVCVYDISRDGADEMACRRDGAGEMVWRSNV